MGSTTTTWQLPYPVAADSADVPFDVKKLADRLEVVLSQLQAATPAQPLAGDLKAVGYPVTAGSEGTQCPGWLLCDGRAVSRTTFAALFAKVGTAHGEGDGSTTFNLPDARGRALVGAGTGPGLTARALGAKMGEESHVIAVGEMPSHDHGGKTAAGSTNPSQTGSTSTVYTNTGAADRALGTNIAGGHFHSPASRQWFMTASGETAQLGSAGTSRYIATAEEGTNTAGDHSHTVSDHLHGIMPHGVNPASIPALTVNGLTISSQGGGAPANVMQPSVVVNVLIKT